MPRRDGTGPMGEGALTGRGFGPCASSDDLENRDNRGMGRGYYGYGYGRGSGRGYGRPQGCGYGRGRRRPFGRGYRRAYLNDETTAVTDKELLSEEKSALQKRLDFIEEQLEKL